MKNFVLIGAGNRAYELFIKPLQFEEYKDSRIVGIYDVNARRAKLLSSFSLYPITVYDDLKQIISDDNIDVIVILTPDYMHVPLIKLCLEHESAVIMCEKPLCTTIEQAEWLYKLPCSKKERIKVLLNSRFMPQNLRIKNILKSGIIGKPLFINYNWYIDIKHGVEYFRRWHSDNEKSGGMLVHKSCHHFDLLNWWIEDTPYGVFSMGNTLFYITNQEIAYNCRKCLNPCQFRMKMPYSPLIKQMYFDNEHIDGYLRDKCIYRDVTIKDTLCSQISYCNGTIVSYSINFYSPFDSWNLAIIGEHGSLLINDFYTNNHIDICMVSHSGDKEMVRVPKNGDKHYGSDRELRKYIFSSINENTFDNWIKLGNCDDGVSAAIIGILSSKSHKDNRCYVNPFI